MMKWISKYRNVIMVWTVFLFFLVAFWLIRLSEIKVDREQIVESYQNGIFIAKYEWIDKIALSEDCGINDTSSIGESIDIVIVDEDAKSTVWRESFPREEVATNSIDNLIKLDNAFALSKDHEYRVYYSSNGAEINTISIALCGDSEPIAGYYFVICAFAILCGIFITVMLYHGINNLNNAFVLIMILLGIISNLTTKPLCVPDESTHFAQSYEVSNRILGRDSSNEYVTIEESGISRNLYDTSIQSALHFYSDYEYGNRKITEPVSTYMLADNIPLYCYLPGGIGITVGRLLGLPYQMIVVLGRIMSTLFLSLMTLVAIKIYSPLKYAVMGISLLPATVWLSSSYSYDVWNLSFIFIFVALCFRIREQECGVRFRDLLMLLLVLVLFAPVKYVYIIVGLAVLFIPFSQWKNKRLFWASGTCIAVIVVIMAATRGKEALSYLFSSNIDGRSSFVTSESVPYTVGWVINHPLNTLLVYINTFIQKSEAFLIKGAVGEFYNSYVPSFITALTILVLLILMITSMQGCEIKRKDRTKAGVIFILGYFTVYTAFLFLFSVTDMNKVGIIDGMQGRYYIPYLVFAPIILKSDRITMRMSLVKEKYLASFNKVKLQELLLIVLVILNLCTMFSKFCGIVIST